MSEIETKSYIANNSTNVAQPQVLFIQADAKDKMILYILTDFVMWQRVSDAMHKIVNCFSSNDENEFEADNEYKGFVTALDFIGITDGDLRDRLSAIAFDRSEGNLPAEETAMNIYASWLKVIKEYTLSNFKTAV